MNNAEPCFLYHREAGVKHVQNMDLRYAYQQARTPNHGSDLLISWSHFPVVPLTP